MSGSFEEILETLKTLAFVLLIVDFLGFLRAWSMDTVSVKGILKFILKIDVLFIISALLTLFFLNIPNIVRLFM